MIDILLFSAKAAFAIMGFAVGFRLYGKSRSDVGVGVHTLGAAVIFIGGVGLFAAAGGEAMADTSRTLAIRSTIAGDVLERIALIGLGVFIWKVFRPDWRGGLGATIVLGLFLSASMVWELYSQPWPHYDASLPSAWSTQLTFALPLAWSAVESAVAWSLGRRRLALGLSEPAAVERFAIWSVACTSFVAICILAVLSPAATDAGHTGLASLFVVLRSACYFVVTAAIWLGMFEPAFYVRRFAADAQPIND